MTDCGLAILGAVLATLVAACSSAGGASPTSTPPSAAGGELTIFAAASLKNMLAEAETAYEAANPGTDLTISTDSSAALETQIEEGAPADVFLSADTTNPQKLVDGGFASGEAVHFAGNKLTVIVPTDNPAGIQSPADLAKPTASGSSRPATRCRSRSTRRSSSTNLAAADGRPGRLRRRLRRERGVEGGQRQRNRVARSSSARAMQGSSMSPMPPRRTRSRRSRSRMRPMFRRPMRAWSSANRRTRTRRRRSSTG